LAIISAMMTACSAKKSDKTAEVETEAKKCLVLYFSETGATKTVAQEFAKLLNADIEAIEAVEPYSGNFQETIARGQQEMQEGKNPEIKPIKAQLSDYDLIFLGFPVWFGTYATPIITLVKNNDFDGKTIIPFCTFGSGGLNTSAAALKTALPKANIVEGYGVRNARVAAAPKEIDRFLKLYGYIPGEVEKLADYSEQKPVTETEKIIFSTACSNYQFPLGTPSTFGVRTTKEGTDYKFIVKSMGQNGQESTSTIYVTVGKNPNDKPEFTEVVR